MKIFSVVPLKVKIRTSEHKARILFYRLSNFCGKIEKSKNRKSQNRFEATNNIGKKVAASAKFLVPRLFLRRPLIDFALQNPSDQIMVCYGLLRLITVVYQETCILYLKKSQAIEYSSYIYSLL